MFIELLRFSGSLASIVNISDHLNVYLNNNGWLKLLLQIYILSNEYFFFFASQKSGVTHAVSCNFAEKEIDSYNFFPLEKKNG